MKKFDPILPKPIRAFLFCLIQWTWAFPQNFIGALLLPILPGKHVRYHCAVITVYKRSKLMGNNTSGFSLGMFIYIPENWSDHDKEHLSVHEFGHTVQSLFFGPLYLFAVGIPSVIWCKRYFKHYWEYQDRGIQYTDRFPENSADKLGEWVTGISPH